MTRFVSSLWNDPACGNLNEETALLFEYHQATKHTYQSVRTNAHYLDWRNQPNPFRVYQGARTIPLPPDPGFPDAGTFATIAGLSSVGNKNADIDPERLEGERLDLMWLSRFLWHSVAISAWKKIPGSGDRYSLRVNPSSGNLHPTETYLILKDFDDVKDGLYHYRADSHALELRSAGNHTAVLAQALGIPWAADASLIVGLTSIFWREAWKYRERAYRYCCHDLGHAMMSLLLAGEAMGLRGGAVSHFADARTAQALGVAEGDEAPMAFLIFAPKVSAVGTPPAAQPVFSGIPNQLSASEVRYEQVLAIHRATILPMTVGPLSVSHTDNSAILTQEELRQPVLDAPLGITVRRRRSALDFDAKSSLMERQHLEQLLDFATRDFRSDWRGNFGGSALNSRNENELITLYLYVHRVSDCEPGVYRWNSAGQTLEQLHHANVERVAAYLSLEQSLAGNSCFTISMVADLEHAARLFGNRGYRYVYFEAGAIGQRLYLGADALGWNATGIGAFYDDDVHRYLGFLPEGEDAVQSAVTTAEKKSLVMLDSPASRDVVERKSDARYSTTTGSADHGSLPQDSEALARQVIYHFAIGRAISDPRLNG